jgi:hypothetical protein
LQQLEDEAFGPPERPGGEGTLDNPFAEAPTEFMAAPEEVAPPPEPIDRSPEAESETGARRESPGIADLQEPPPPPPALEGDAPAIDADQEGESAKEGDAGPASDSPTTDERRAIAEQPTELFDVEAEIDAAQSAAPTDEELAEEEVAEPRLAPVDPFAGLGEPDVEPELVIGEEQEEEEEDFFDEQRLSDELDQALEAPVEREAPVKPEDLVEEKPETEPRELGEEQSLDPVTGGENDDRDREDDVLEDTPDFLENSDDDELWFEQKPPKDFDFDD